MSQAGSRSAFMRMFSSALASQAVLSATSFLVGLLLIRRSSDLQYGYYVLISGAILLAASLQNAFIGPSMVHRLTRLDREPRGDLTGGLYREQRFVIVRVAAAALAVTIGLRVGGYMDPTSGWLVIAAIVATVLALRREYFRMVLLAYRRSHQVLAGDLLYALLMIVGVMMATRSSAPAILAVLAIGLAALVASTQLAHSLTRLEAWNVNGVPGILREIAPLGTWSTAGAAIHWTFSQGYTWLIAGTLDVSAIAAIAATRLLAMPVNLLSSGIGSLMLPLASRWLHEQGAPLVLRRLVGFALTVSLISILYFAALWSVRDWVFDHLLKKSFAQRDLLLLLWSAVFVLMVIHQQLLYLLVVRARFRKLTALTAVSALLALASSWWAMRHFGGVGAPLGVLIGEFVNTVGVIVLCLREVSPRASESTELPQGVS
jgi:O-antigen/teichoic acid export membrane protein